MGGSAVLPGASFRHQAAVPGSVVPGPSPCSRPLRRHLLMGEPPRPPRPPGSRTRARAAAGDLERDQHRAGRLLRDAVAHGPSCQDVCDPCSVPQLGAHSGAADEEPGGAGGARGARPPPGLEKEAPRRHPQHPSDVRLPRKTSVCSWLLLGAADSPHRAPAPTRLEPLLPVGRAPRGRSARVCEGLHTTPRRGGLSRKQGSLHGSRGVLLGRSGL